MSKTLIVQTDSTDKFKFHLDVDSEHQPHLVRLAWSVMDNDDDVTSAPCMLIRPQRGWVYDPGAAANNLVTRDLGLRYGVPMEEAMGRFLGALNTADTIVAFNWDFHRHMLFRSAAECGLHWQDMFDGHHQVCAMREATDIVQVPRIAPGGGFMWPKLSVAYEFFTGEQLPVDLDPIQRGCTMAEAVRRIYLGIRETNMSVGHE